MIVVLSIHVTALDPSFYNERYQQERMDQKLNVSLDDLDKSITCLLEYISGEREDMDVEITINGQEQSAFNAKEKEHMVDVRNLYISCIRVGWVCFGIVAIGMLYFMIRYKKEALYYFCRGFLMALVSFFGLLVFFGIWMAIDFTDFWTWFHTVFFSNDLWLLNPATDFMIRMLPENIFFELITSIVVLVSVVIVPLALGSIYIERKVVPIGYFSTKGGESS